MPLSGKQKMYLRGLGHQLKPVILLGNAGFSDAVHAELTTTLEHHELIKIKVGVGERDERQAIIDDICLKSGAELVQTIGKMALIYKQAKTPKISFPR